MIPILLIQKQKRYLLEVTDKALDKIVEDLIKQAQDLISATGFITSEEVEVSRIVKCFRKGVPASSTNGLPDILNAAWPGTLDDGLWADFPHLKGDPNRRSSRILYLRILKSLKSINDRKLPRHD